MQQQIGQLKHISTVIYSGGGAAGAGGGGAAAAAAGGGHCSNPVRLSPSAFVIEAPKRFPHVWRRH